MNIQPITFFNDKCVEKKRSKFSKTSVINDNNSFSSNCILNLQHKSYNVCFRQNSSLLKRTFKQLSISQLLEDGYQNAIVKNNKIVNKTPYILLSKKSDLLALANSPLAWNKTYVLSSDIDFEDEAINIIGNIKNSFTGSFNGNYYTISNFKISAPNTNRVGFFGMCSNADISNLFLKNVNVSGKNNVGLLIGFAEDNTTISNVEAEGNVAGKNNVGGIAGYLDGSNVCNCFTNGAILSQDILRIPDECSFFENVEVCNNPDYVGGIAGSANNSQITASKSSMQINGENYVGGIVGLLDFSKLLDCISESELKALNEQSVGALSSIANFSQIKDSCAISRYPIIAKNEESDVINCISTISDLAKGVCTYWNKGNWNISGNRLPRLINDPNNQNIAKIFFEDVQSDIAIGNIKLKSINYLPPTHIQQTLDDMEPPKHYTENDRILKKIKDSIFHHELMNIFVYWTNGFRSGFNVTDTKHDEILLELVKNKHFNLTKRYEGDLFILEEAIWCTPLYVLSQLPKGYIFQEALKRDDINPAVKNGDNHNTDMFEQMYNAPITTNMVVLFNSDNPIVKNYVKNSLKYKRGIQSPDIITNILCKNPAGTIKYEEDTHSLLIPISLLNQDIKTIHYKHEKINSLYDMLISPEIDTNYQDSFGNSFLHILSQLTELEQSAFLELAMQKGANVNLKNNDGKTPLQIAMEKKKPILYTNLIKYNPNDKFRVDEDGNNALMQNAKVSKYEQSIINIDRLHEIGFSVNTSNNDLSTPLIEAVEQNDIKKVNYLLLKGADVNKCNKNGQTALHMAFINENPLLIKWLLDKYAVPNMRDNRGFLPQDYWQEGKNVLMKKGIDIDAIRAEYNIIFGDDAFNTKDFSQLNPIELTLPTDNYSDFAKKIILSSNPNSTELLSQLISKQLIEINKKDDEGNTLLITALKAYCDLDTVQKKLMCMQNIKLLSDNNAEVDITDNNTQSALHHVIFTNNLILFNELLSKHPNVNFSDALGNSPLFYLGTDLNNPMRKVFDVYAKKRQITLPDSYNKM